MNTLTKKVSWDAKNKYFRVKCKEYPNIVKLGKTEIEALEEFNKYFEEMWKWESSKVYTLES